MKQAYLCTRENWHMLERIKNKIVKGNFKPTATSGGILEQELKKRLNIS